MGKLYDSGEMSVDGKRARWNVTKTDKGVEVLDESLYSDKPAVIHYYRDGNYPELPQDWDAVINDYGTTAAEVWLHELQGHTADRVISPYARAMGRKTSAAKVTTARQNGLKGGRPRKY